MSALGPLLTPLATFAAQCEAMRILITRPMDVRSLVMLHVLMGKSKSQTEYQLCHSTHQFCYIRICYESYDGSSVPTGRTLLPLPSIRARGDGRRGRGNVILRKM
jgi:hypothetical protein